jgi:hypothetical protein
MNKYDDNLEKVLTAVFGCIGTGAIVVSLFIHGWTTENILSALVDLAGLVVVIAVFLIANKLFIRDKKFDFMLRFEHHLKEWIQQNDYLIDLNDLDGEGKGKLNKRYCSMVIDHSNLITKGKKAKHAVAKKEKGAFVYLPYPDENGLLRNDFDFRFNERTFERQKIYRDDNNAVDLGTIIKQFASRIDDSFKSLGIETRANPSQKTITVSFADMDRTEDNARRLVDIVEFVKTMVIALA